MRERCPRKPMWERETACWIQSLVPNPPETLSCGLVSTRVPSRTAEGPRESARVPLLCVGPAAAHVFAARLRAPVPSGPRVPRTVLSPAGCSPRGHDKKLHRIGSHTSRSRTNESRDHVVSGLLPSTAATVTSRGSSRGPHLTTLTWTK